MYVMMVTLKDWNMIEVLLTIKTQSHFVDI